MPILAKSAALANRFHPGIQLRDVSWLCETPGRKAFDLTLVGFGVTRIRILPKATNDDDVTAKEED